MEKHSMYLLEFLHSEVLIWVPVVGFSWTRLAVWDGAQLNWSIPMLCDIRQQSFSTGKVVSWSNYCFIQHLCACQFYLSNEDCKKQKARLTSGSHVWMLRVVWEHTDMAERCFLGCLPCVQRESFRWKFYQSLCSLQTKCSRAQFKSTYRTDSELPF